MLEILLLLYSLFTTNLWTWLKIAMLLLTPQLYCCFWQFPIYGASDWHGEYGGMHSLSLYTRLLDARQNWCHFPPKSRQSCNDVNLTLKMYEELLLQLHICVLRGVVTSTHIPIDYSIFHNICYVHRTWFPKGKELIYLYELDIHQHIDIGWGY